MTVSACSVRSWRRRGSCATSALGACASRSKARCHCPTTSASASCSNSGRSSRRNRSWKPASIRNCSAAWCCRSATGCMTGRSVPNWRTSGNRSSKEAAMRFKADEIVSVLQTEIDQYRAKLDAREVGRVLEVGDGIARVYGLSGVMAGEMVEFTRTGVRGLAFNLEENSVGVIILGEYLEIAEGDEVRAMGELLRVPVGPA